MIPWVNKWEILNWQKKKYISLLGNFSELLLANLIAALQEKNMVYMVAQ